MAGATSPSRAGISQSTLIVGALVLAFVAWTTLRGTFKNYLSDLGLGGTTTTTATTATPTASQVLNPVGANSIANLVGGNASALLTGTGASGANIPAGSNNASQPLSAYYDPLASLTALA